MRGSLESSLVNWPLSVVYLWLYYYPFVSECKNNQFWEKLYQAARWNSLYPLSVTVPDTRVNTKVNGILFHSWVWHPVSPRAFAVAALFSMHRLGPWVWGHCPWLLWVCECSCHSTPNLWFDVALPIWVITLYWVHRGLMNRVLNYYFSLMATENCQWRTWFWGWTSIFFPIKPKVIWEETGSWPTGR